MMEPPSALSLATPEGGRPPEARRSRFLGGQLGPGAPLRYAALGLVALVMLYPLAWLVGASFKSNADIFTQAGFWPSRIDFGAYAKGWKTSSEYTFATYFLNSFADHHSAGDRDGDLLRAGGLCVCPLRLLGQENAVRHHGGAR